MKRYVILLLLLLVMQVGCSTPPIPADQTPQENDKTANSTEPSVSAHDTKEADKQPQQKPLLTAGGADSKLKKNNSQSAPVTPKPKPGNEKLEEHKRADTSTDVAAAAPREMDRRVLMSGSKPNVARRQTIQSYSAAGIAPVVPPRIRYPSEPLDRENYEHFEDNPVLRVAEKPVSTFSIDVDTGSYTNSRRILHEGRLPAKDVVRVEEFINYFNYDYPAPESQDTPFNVITELGPTPWNRKTHLLHIGIKGYQLPETQLPPSNLVFLIDVSGSMRSQNKLALLKKSLQLLTQKLRAEDKISIVVYAGASGVVLEPTAGSNKARILTALESLSAGGSTNGAAGIRLAYLKAQQGFIKGGINRVILATDGDFNVGTVNFEALKNLVEEKRKSGVFLTTLGFGAGNYNDHLMEQLADAGNGNYAYIDTLMEAQKVLVHEMGSTLNAIAKDVKIQIEFNPAVVAEYRLVGYENRALRREDFNNDKVDAGEIGAGHTVTAIYEIALQGQDEQMVDPLRYQEGETAANKTSQANELAFLRLRYKKPDSEKSILMETPVPKSQMIDSLAKTSERFQFAASVAAFGQLLRGGRYTQQYAYSDIVKLALSARGKDRYGYRSEFVRLVELAETLSGNARAQQSGKARAQQSGKARAQQSGKAFN
jgi:Ca-activated chloride channel family protein